MPVGKVYLVGAGPGDPGLITVRGLDCIRQADVLVYDRLVSPALVAQAPASTEKIYVGKEVGQSGRRQVNISQLLADLALAGKIVCRLKGGDPFVFGRGGEEGEVLADRGVPFTVVPGITAGVAAPSYAGIPVTHRDFAGAVTLVTGHDAPDKRGRRSDWASLAKGNTTLLIYMGIEGIDEIANRLMFHGRGVETPVAVIRWGTRAEQQTLVGTLKTIADQVRATSMKSPAMIVVGEVVGLRDRLNWAEWRPLFGRRVLIPGLSHTKSPVAALLSDAGAEVWEWEVGGAIPSPDHHSPRRFKPRIDTKDLLSEALMGGAVQDIFFAEPVTVSLLIGLVGSRALTGLRIFCQDETTASFAAQAGLSVEAITPTGAELVRSAAVAGAAAIA